MSSNGTKSSEQLRQALKKDRVSLQVEEMERVVDELKKIYDERSASGKTPSDDYEKLILLLQQELDIWDHPDRDLFYVCPACGRK